MICICANIVKKPLSQEGREMNFAARSVRTSLMFTNQRKRKRGTKAMIENRNVNIITDADDARLLINHAENGRKYLYDILAIKKETSKP